MIFLFFLVLQLSLFANALDVETLPFLRTREYPKEPYDKIMVFSAPRTGSSLVYNTFRFLFEKEEFLSSPHDEFRLDRSVLKTHKIPDMETLKQTNGRVLYIVTLRDPLQASISTCRILPRAIEDMAAFCKKLVDRQVRCLHFFEQLKERGCPVEILRYEDFEENPFRYLLDFIETHFHLSVSNRDVELLEAGYSKENIYLNIQSLHDFKEVLPLSGFHGKHVSLEPFTPSEDFLYWIHHYLEEVKPLFKKYGYFSGSESGEGTMNSQEKKKFQ